jgi:hypothetical protein
MLHQIALVAKVKQIAFTEVARVAAAVQKQILRDLAPMWDLRASVAAFPSLKDIPFGYWPVVVLDDLHAPGASGHHLDKDGRPFALVEYGPTWSLAASHECLEMAIDPSGARQVSGPSPLSAQGEVGFLLEACGPSADAQFGYTVDGVLVSDFCTPQFFDCNAGGAVRYSFTGAIGKPLETLKNGYLSWCDPASRSWYQAQYLGNQPKIVALGQPGAAFRCMREFTSRGEVDHQRLSHFSAASPISRRSQLRSKQHAEASAATADRLAEEIADVGRRLGETINRRRRERVESILSAS